MYFRSTNVNGIGTWARVLHNTGNQQINGNIHINAPAVGNTLNNYELGAKIDIGRQKLEFVSLRTANESDWKNTTLKLQTKIDNTTHQSIDFVNDNAWHEHIDILTGNQSFNTRFTYDGKVGIGTTTPSVPLEVYKGAGTEVVAQFRTPEGAINIAAAGNSIGNSTYGNYISSRNSNNTAYKDLGLKTTGGVPQFMIKTNGNVGIGTTSPSQKLEVNGTIRSKEVKVEANGWPDYVFEPSYDLRTLKETKKYITKHKHLPEIPSASEIGENGIDLGDMNMRLLKKIEELTLYQIDLLEKVEELQKKVEKLEKK